MARLTGLQKDVLGLYRQCLRAVRTKPAVSIDVQRAVDIIFKSEIFSFVLQENREHCRQLAR